MIERYIARLIARYGVFPIAVAGFILLTIGLFAGIAGWNAIKSHWFEKKAERAEVRADKAERAADVAIADRKQVDKATDILKDTTSRQDASAKTQRRDTAKAIEVIDARIEAVPVVIDLDPIVMHEVHQARNRAIAAQDRVQRAPDN
jgi:hypothetical protein